jgi:hypothetical protein
VVAGEKYGGLSGAIDANRPVIQANDVHGAMPRRWLNTVGNLVTHNVPVQARAASCASPATGGYVAH